MDNLWRKKQILLFKYYFRYFLRKFSISLFLFLISLVLFAFVFFPSLGQTIRQSNLISNRPIELKIEGVVYKINETGNKEFISGVLIETGGYKTTSDINGYYELSFNTVNLTDIPVIYSYQENEIIKRYSFDKTLISIKGDILIP